MLLSFDLCFLLSSMMAAYPLRCRICNSLAWNSFDLIWCAVGIQVLSVALGFGTD